MTMTLQPGLLRLRRKLQKFHLHTGYRFYSPIFGVRTMDVLCCDHHNYRADAEYLYPASTVKLAIAALALEYMQQLSGYGVTIDSVMHTEPLLEGDTLVSQDTSAASGLPSVQTLHEKNSISQRQRRL